MSALEILKSKVSRARNHEMNNCALTTNPESTIEVERDFVLICTNDDGTIISMNVLSTQLHMASLCGKLVWVLFLLFVDNFFSSSTHFCQTC
jgi:hypothetical protein